MSRLPALPANDVYEVWVERDGSLEPSSLFVPRRDGTAEAAVTGPLDDADAVLVTREPRGGSQQPDLAAAASRRSALAPARARRTRART